MSDSWTPGTPSAVTVFTEDLAASREFYRRVFALDVVFEDADSVVFRLGDTLLNVLAVRAATGLVAPVPAAPPEAGVRMQFTLGVEDVDATAAQLRERGVELLRGPEDRPWGIRTATFRDPSGHLWEIAR